MRILHLCAGNLYGGVERMLTTLARHRHLAPAMEPHFAICAEGRLEEELRAAGAAIHRLPPVRFSRPWSVWRARRKLREIFSDAGIDALICHGCWPHALGAPVARSKRLPVVFWAHDIPNGTHWLERLASRTSPDLILANSEYTLLTIPKLFAGAPAVLQRNPVSPPDSDCAAPSLRQTVRLLMGVDDLSVVIVLAARLERWKGHTLLLDALASAAMRGRKDWQAWIVGAPQRPHEQVYFDELKARASRNDLAGRVKFLGQRDDVGRLMTAADIHCQPNTGPEPFGIAFIEALYRGLPVVTTRLGAAPEIVDDTCGILAPPDDPIRLSAALGELLDSPERRASFASNGPARALLLCDPEIRLVELADRLMPLAAGKHAEQCAAASDIQT